MNRCRVCSCTDTQACEGGCWWVEPDLCNRCKNLENKKMKTIKPKRVTIEVVWSKANQSWQVRGKNRLILASRDNKPDAIAAAITICERRESAELIIKNKNGTIGKGGSAKRSYPRASDPKGSRG